VWADSRTFWEAASTMDSVSDGFYLQIPPLPVTITLTNQQFGKSSRVSRTTDLKIKLETSRLRRRLDSKLDLLMGKMLKELQALRRKTWKL